MGKQCTSSFTIIILTQVIKLVGITCCFTIALRIPKNPLFSALTVMAEPTDSPPAPSLPPDLCHCLSVSPG